MGQSMWTYNCMGIHNYLKIKSLINKQTNTLTANKNFRKITFHLKYILSLTEVTQVSDSNTKTLLESQIQLVQGKQHLKQIK